MGFLVWKCVTSQHHTADCHSNRPMVCMTILWDPPWRQLGCDWTGFSWSLTGGHSSKNYREEMTNSGNDARGYCESTFCRDCVDMQPSVVFVEEIWEISNEFSSLKRTHYHFCILSPFHSSSGLCKHKKCSNSLCPVLSTCKSFEIQHTWWWVKDFIMDIL